MRELADQFLSYLRAAWRYRWHAAVFAWLIALGGWTVVHQLPNRYEAHARVFVDTQSMLRPLLAGIAVQPNVDQMVAMMGRTLISRANIEKVIEMAAIEPVANASEKREQLIARLIRDISIKSAGRENLYTITFADSDRGRAKRVVQSLLTIFVEGSVGDKRKDSDSAQEFIEEQLASYSAKLVAAESAVVAFKRRHQGLIPGEGHNFYGPLAEAKAALRKATLELNEAQNSRDAIRQQIADVTQTRAQQAEKGVVTKPLSELDLRIRALEQKLDSLRLVYTEQHPDIVASTRIVGQLKLQRAAEEETKADEQDPDSGAAAKPAVRVPQGALYDQLKISLAAAEANIAAMKARVSEYTIRYSELQAAANALPQIEAEYKQLTRDYEVTKARYDKLLERRESAQLSGAVEASDVGMGFRVVEPPQVPPAPISPNRVQLLTLVLVAALAGGAGLAVVLSQLKVTFSDEQRLREAIGMAVLGSVAMSWNVKQKWRRAGGLIALLLTFLGLLGAYGAILVPLMVSGTRV